MQKADALILWPPDVKSQFTGKDPDAGKDWGQEEKGTAEDETDSIDNSMDVTLSKLRETVKDRGVVQCTGSQRARHGLGAEPQQQRSRAYCAGGTQVFLFSIIFLGLDKAE